MLRLRPSLDRATYYPTKLTHNVCMLSIQHMLGPWVRVGGNNLFTRLGIAEGFWPCCEADFGKVTTFLRDQGIFGQN
jgi:hypothetical protein